MPTGFQIVSARRADLDLSRQALLADGRPSGQLGLLRGTHGGSAGDRRPFIRRKTRPGSTRDGWMGDGGDGCPAHRPQGQTPRDQVRSAPWHCPGLVSPLAQGKAPLGTHLPQARARGWRTGDAHPTPRKTRAGGLGVRTVQAPGEAGPAPGARTSQAPTRGRGSEPAHTHELCGAHSLPGSV